MTKRIFFEDLTNNQLHGALLWGQVEYLICLNKVKQLHRGEQKITIYQYKDSCSVTNSKQPK